MAANNARAQMAGGKNRSNNSLSQYKSVRVDGKRIFLIPVTGHKGLYTLKTEDGRFAGSEKVFSAKTSGDAVKHMKRVAKEIEAELAASAAPTDGDKVTVDDYLSSTYSLSGDEVIDGSFQMNAPAEVEEEKGLGFFRKAKIATTNSVSAVAASSTLIADSLSDKVLEGMTDRGHSMISKALSEVASASDRDMLGTGAPARLTQTLSRKAMSMHKDSIRRDKREFEYGILSERKRLAAEGHAANEAALKEYKEPLYNKLDKMKADLEIERRNALAAEDTEALSEINIRSRKLAEQRKALDTHVPKDFKPPYPKLPKKTTNYGQKGMRLRDRMKIMQAEIDMRNQDSYRAAEQELRERRTATKTAKQAEKQATK